MGRMIIEVIEAVTVPRPSKQVIVLGVVLGELITKEEGMSKILLEILIKTLENMNPVIQALTVVSLVITIGHECYDAWEEYEERHA